jgi:hypothetical protein
MRRNLRGTGKPRGRREISACASGGDQANRQKPTRLPVSGVPDMPGGVVEGQHLSDVGRKPGPDPPGFSGLGAGLSTTWGGASSASGLFPERGT